MPHHPTKRPDITAIFEEGTAMLAALQDAARAVRLQHKLLGHPIVVWRDGKVVEIPPEEIVVEQAAAAKVKENDAA